MEENPGSERNVGHSELCGVSAQAGVTEVASIRSRLKPGRPSAGPSSLGEYNENTGAHSCFTVLHPGHPGSGNR